MGSTNVTVEISIEGHASNRWRGARNAADAAERNQLLSVARAQAVGKIIEAQLRRRLDGATFVLSGTGFPQLKAPVEGKVVAYGSGRPIVIESGRGNHPLNRSVIVALQAVRRTQSGLIKHRYVPVTAYSKYWGMEVLEFNAAALGVGAGDIRFRLTNGATNKSRRYSAQLSGLGLDNPFEDFKDPYKNPIKEKPPKPRIEPEPEKVWFEVGTQIGFNEFDRDPGRNIVVKKLKGGVGIPFTKIGFGASDTSLGFEGLGGNSDSIGFESSFEISGTTINYYRLTGQITPIDPHPGDTLNIGIESWYEPLPDSINTVNNAMLVMFETGKSEVPVFFKKGLEHWASKWAANLSVLAGHELR